MFRDSVSVNVQEKVKEEELRVVKVPISSHWVAAIKSRVKINMDNMTMTSADINTPMNWGDPPGTTGLFYENPGVIGNSVVLANGSILAGVIDCKNLEKGWELA